MVKKWKDYKDKERLASQVHKVVMSNYSFKEIMKMNASEYQKAGFSKSKLKKSSLEGSKRLLKQAKKYQQERSVPILNYNLKNKLFSKGITRKAFIDIYIKEYKKLFYDKKQQITPPTNLYHQPNIKNKHLGKRNKFQDVRLFSFQYYEKPYGRNGLWTNGNNWFDIKNKILTDLNVLLSFFKQHLTQISKNFAYQLGFTLTIEVRDKNYYKNNEKIGQKTFTRNYFSSLKREITRIVGKKRNQNQLSILDKFFIDLAISKEYHIYISDIFFYVFSLRKITKF